MKRSELKEYFEILCNNNYPTFIDKYIELDEFKRIDQIGQFCGCDYPKLFNIKFWYSRLDHSIATALMTWHFTHDKTQTLATLFHDLGTPVFSHCIDYLLGDTKNQESSEKDVYQIIINSNKIMEYLELDNVEVKDLEDISKYPIVENNKPKICVDRLDGILTTCFIWSPIWNIDDIKKIYNDIIVLEENNIPEIGFKTKEICERFFEGVYHYSIILQQNEDKYTMMYIADAVKKAIDNNYLTFEDLYSKGEREIVEILKEKISSWKTFENVKAIVRTNYLPHQYHVSLDSKKRYVVPLCLHNGKAVRLNEISSICQKLLEKYLSYEDTKYSYCEDIISV